MKNLSKPIIAAIAALSFMSGAQALTLTFDDLPATSAVSSIFTTTYNGLSFGNLDLKTNTWGWNSQNPNPPYAAASGTTSVATDPAFYDPNNFFEESEAVTAGFTFVFGGAYFNGFDINPDNTQAQVQINLYLGGNLVGSSGVLDLSSVPTFLPTNYAGLIDSFTILGPQGYWVMDSAEVTPTIPEPASAALVTLALAGMGAASRRKAKA